MVVVTGLLLGQQSEGVGEAQLHVDDERDERERAQHHRAVQHPLLPLAQIGQPAHDNVARLRLLRVADGKRPFSHEIEAKSFVLLRFGRIASAR